MQREDRDFYSESLGNTKGNEAPQTQKDIQVTSVRKS